MSSFPLYDNLNQQTENISETLTSEQKNILTESLFPTVKRLILILLEKAKLLENMK